MSPAVTVSGMTVSFGGLNALSNVSLNAEQGEITGLIGPNGAGKTTMLNVITGFQKPTKGTVHLFGEDVTGKSPHAIASSGVLRTFQGTRPLADRSVLGNAVAGTYRVAGAGAIGGILGLPSARRREYDAVNLAIEVLDRVGLTDVAANFPAELTSGQLRLLEIARVLAGAPRMLLLDEPAAGLTHGESEVLGDLVLSVRDGGVTCVVVEHDVDLLFRISDHVVALDFGELLVEGPPELVRHDPALVRAYLGIPEGQESGG